MIQAKDLQPGEVLVTPTGNNQLFTLTVETVDHHFTADEPKDLGGDHQGMAPFELLSASLATCTAMTLRFYAKREDLDLGAFQVKVWAEQHKEAGPAGYTLKRQLFLKDVKSPKMREKLLEIAEKCPVSRALKAGIEITS